MAQAARKTLVIAEIGENHTGDWDLARRMVVAAARSGAAFVKFQSYLGTEVSEDDPERDWFTRVHLPDAQHFELKALAEANGAEFLTAVFSLERARFAVERLGLRKIKVASSELLNRPLLDYLNAADLDAVFLSTGMATLDEVREAAARLDRVRDLCIMHCTTEYPCPEEHANLAAIPVLRAAFPRRRIGFSDHTLGTLAPALAVALGAEVVEKHFTLDKTLPGTDHVLSVTPGELVEMIALIDRAEAMRGDGVKQPTPKEVEIRDFVRRRFPK